MDSDFDKLINKYSTRKKILFVIFLFILFLLMGFACCELVHIAKDIQLSNTSSLVMQHNSDLDLQGKATPVSDTELCTGIGKKLLMKNGSAIDAAISTLVCMGVVDCKNSGMGGEILITSYDKLNQTLKVLDIKRNSTKDILKNDPNKIFIDELKSYEIAYNELGGRFNWSELFVPTIELCNNGFPVTKHLAEVFEKYRDSILKDPLLRNVLVNNETGQIYKEDEIIINRDLAGIFENISDKDSVIKIYEIEKTQKKIGMNTSNIEGRIPENDLQNYKVILRNLSKIPLGSNLIVYGVLPSRSVSLLSNLINILDSLNLSSNFDLTIPNEVSITFHRVLEEFEYISTKNIEAINSSSLLKTVKNMLNRKYSNEIPAKISNVAKVYDSKHYKVKQYAKEDARAKLIVIMEPNGNVLITSVINSDFGCKLMWPLADIILNNKMNLSIPSYKERRLISYMEPTVLVDKGEMRMIIARESETQIITNKDSHCKSFSLNKMLKKLLICEDYIKYSSIIYFRK